jgi:TRAP-type mannitol/chloroaromatic compound transport system substrate-binding protein
MKMKNGFSCLWTGAGPGDRSFAANPRQAAPHSHWRLARSTRWTATSDIRAKAFAKKVFDRTNGRIQIDVDSPAACWGWTETFDMLMRRQHRNDEGPGNANLTQAEPGYTSLPGHQM